MPESPGEKWSMETDRIAKLKERDKAMRAARDEILTRVGAWLRSKDFDRAGAGHFTRSQNGLLCHIGFQKHTSGRSVRVMCHVTSGTDAKTLVSGPWSDAYERPGSPNGKKYNFRWGTRETDIARCVDEYCRYINDVVLAWFHDPADKAKA